jgi:hypothetical protein
MRLQSFARVTASLVGVCLILVPGCDDDSGKMLLK